MEYTKDYWIGWLQGFADAEAYVGIPKFEIVVSNSEKDLLEHYQKGLDFFGILSKLYGPYYSKSNPKALPMYRLKIHRQQAIRDWARLIGFQSKPHKEKLSFLISKISI